EFGRSFSRNKVQKPLKMGDEGFRVGISSGVQVAIDLRLELKDTPVKAQEIPGERPLFLEELGAPDPLLEEAGHQAWGSRTCPVAHPSSILAGVWGALSCSSAQVPWWCFAHSSLTVPSVMARSAPWVMITAMWMCMTIERIAPTADTEWMTIAQRRRSRLNSAGNQIGMPLSSRTR